MIRDLKINDGVLIGVGAGTFIQLGRTVSSLSHQVIKGIGDGLWISDLIATCVLGIIFLWLYYILD